MYPFISYVELLLRTYYAFLYHVCRQNNKNLESFETISNFLLTRFAICCKFITKLVCRIVRIARIISDVELLLRTYYAFLYHVCRQNNKNLESFETISNFLRDLQFVVNLLLNYRILLHTVQASNIYTTFETLCTNFFQCDQQ